MKVTRCLTIVAVSVFATTVGYAGFVVIDYNDPNGLHWTGIVDTVADNLTIHTWTNNSGGRWTPTLDSLPLVWPAVTSTELPFDDGSFYDVPDTFATTLIDSEFGFISSVPLDEMAWNEGVAPAIGQYPGWGGYRNDVFTVVSHHDETVMWGLLVQLGGGSFSVGSNRGSDVVITVTNVPEPRPLFCVDFLLLGLGLTVTRRKFTTHGRQNRQNGPSRPCEPFGVRQRWAVAIPVAPMPRDFYRKPNISETIRRYHSMATKSAGVQRLASMRVMSVSTGDRSDNQPDRADDQGR